jgi:hypothetical protein
MIHVNRQIFFLPSSAATTALQTALQCVGFVWRQKGLLLKSDVQRVEHWWVGLVAGLFLLIGGRAAPLFAQAPQGLVLEYRLAVEGKGEQVPRFRAALPPYRKVWVADSLSLSWQPDLLNGTALTQRVNYATGQSWSIDSSTQTVYEQLLYGLTDMAILPPEGKYTAAGQEVWGGFKCQKYTAKVDIPDLGGEVVFTLWLNPAFARAAARDTTLPTEVLLARGALGLPVRKEIRLVRLGVVLHEQLMNFEQTEIPASRFALPEGWPVRPFDPMQRLPGEAE